MWIHTTKHPMDIVPLDKEEFYLELRRHGFMSARQLSRYVGVESDYISDTFSRYKGLPKDIYEACQRAFSENDAKMESVATDGEKRLKDFSKNDLYDSIYDAMYKATIDVMKEDSNEVEE